MFAYTGGLQGIQGVQGDEGDAGAQGIQGVQGDAGAQGDQGIQGIQGVKGDTGDAGVANFTDKGDVAAVDYGVATFTKDSAYHILDISSKIGAGACYVLIRMDVLFTGVTEHFEIKTNGNSNEHNAFVSGDKPANVTYTLSGWVLTDADGKIEYRFSTGTWTSINMRIRAYLTL